MELPTDTEAKALESWIEFEWRPVEDIDSANLLPREMAQFASNANPTPLPDVVCGK